MVSRLYIVAEQHYAMSSNFVGLKPLQQNQTSPWSQENQLTERTTKAGALCWVKVLMPIGLALIFDDAIAAISRNNWLKKD